MVEIQRHIVRRGKRGVFSRPFHAKDDSKTIAAWRSDLDRIRRVVEVRSLLLPSSRRLSTFCFQTELATDANDPAVLQGTSDFHVIVSEPHSDVSTAGVLEYSRDVLRAGTVVPGIDHYSAHPHAILSDKRTDDHTAASDVHHRTRKIREDDGSRYRAVSTPLTCPSPNSGSSPLT